MRVLLGLRAALGRDVGAEFGEGQEDGLVDAAGVVGEEHGTPVGKLEALAVEAGDGASAGQAVDRLAEAPAQLDLEPSGHGLACCGQMVQQHGQSPGKARRPLVRCPQDGQHQIGFVQKHRLFIYDQGRSPRLSRFPKRESPSPLASSIPAASRERAKLRETAAQDARRAVRS